MKRKPNRPYVIRYEWFLSKSTAEKDKDKEKESRYQIINVDAKTDREFVVMTVCTRLGLKYRVYQRLMSYFIEHQVPLLPHHEHSCDINLGS